MTKPDPAIVNRVHELTVSWRRQQRRPPKQLNRAQSILAKCRVEIIKLEESLAAAHEAICRCRQVVRWVNNPSPRQLSFPAVCEAAGIGEENALARLFAGLSEDAIAEIIHGNTPCPACGKRH